MNIQEGEFGKKEVITFRPQAVRAAQEREGRFFGCRAYHQYAVGIRQIGAGQPDSLIHTGRAKQLIIIRINEFF